MRDIKFRAFHKDTKEIYSVDYISLKEGYIESSDVFQPMLFEHVELMQFTGLIDKNGVEIYEGSILFDGDWNLAVVYNGGDAVFMTHHNPSNDFELLCATSSSLLSVIGNIHQNPKLLK